MVIVIYFRKVNLYSRITKLILEKSMNYLTIISSYVLGVIFVVAGVNKILHYSLFVDEISAYGVVPTHLVPYLASPLILAEMWVGVGLFIGSWRKLAAISSSTLLVLFGVVLSVAYLKGSSSACGCMLPFGSQTIGPVHIVQDLVLLCLSVVIWSNQK